MSPRCTTRWPRASSSTTSSSGLCEAGGASELLASGATRIGGRIAVNPSGGLCSRGHPVGATGLAQMTELTWQLRGEAGERQSRPAPPGAGPELGRLAGGRVGDLDVHILERADPWG